LGKNVEALKKAKYFIVSREYLIKKKTNKYS